MLLVRDCLFVVPTYAYFAADLHIQEVMSLSSTWDVGAGRQLCSGKTSNRFHRTADHSTSPQTAQVFVSFLFCKQLVDFYSRTESNFSSVSCVTPVLVRWRPLSRQRTGCNTANSSQAGTEKSTTSQSHLVCLQFPELICICGDLLQN